MYEAGTMKSFAHRSLPLKKIKKLAAQFSERDIQASLPTSVERCYLFETADGGAVVGFWSDNGPRILMDDDSVRAYAQHEYLRLRGQPTFSSDSELNEYASKAGWLKPMP